jgi:hypothetical protein
LIRNGTLVAASILTLLAAVARADGDYASPTEDRMRMSLGVMQVGASTSLQVDSSSGAAGTYINGENTLGLDKTQYDPKFQAEVRAGERNRVRIDYFALDRSNTRTLTGAPLAFGDAILLVGDPVLTDLSFRDFELTYGYSFVRNATVEVAGTVSVNAIDGSARLRVATATRHVDSRQDFAGPYPNPGIEATWVLSKRFYLDGRAQFLRVSVDHLSGSLGLYELDALYRLRPNISFALGYNMVRANLASRQASEGGLFQFDTQGPQLFVRVAF